MRFPHGRMHRALIVVTIAAGVGFGPPPFACAQDSTRAAGAAVPWWRSVTLNGFVSSSISYNFNRPPSNLNTYRVFDFDDHTFKLDVMELVMQRLPAKAGEAGFRVDFTAGSSIPRVAASTGLFRDAEGKSGDVDMHQAYVGYLARVGRGLRLDAGKFVTPFGYEVIEGYDGYNDNATRSFLFGYAIPFTHTGLRASYALNSRLTGLLMLVNGWDNSIDNNREKSIGAQLAWAASSRWNASLGGMYGAERLDASGDPRVVVDLAGAWRPSAISAVGLNADYGWERNSLGGYDGQTGLPLPGRNTAW